MRHAILSAPLPLALLCGLAGVMLLAGCAAGTASERGASVYAHQPSASEALLPGGAALQPAQADSVQARQLFVRGMTQAYVDDHRRAIAFYEAALRLAPNEAALLSAMADSYAALAEMRTALFYAEQARERDPENAYLYQQLAELYLETGDLERAAQAYQELLAHVPGHTGALQELARVQSARGQYEAALATYERLLEVVGEQPAVQHRMLQLYLRLGHSTRAAHLLKRMIAEDPGNSELRRLLAEQYVREERLEQAVEVLEESLAAGDAGALLLLTDLYRQLGAEEKAEALLSDPDGAASPAQLVTQATALLTRRAASDPQAGLTAARLLERALELDPQHPDALVLLGRLRLQDSRYAEAADLLARALEHNPRDPELWVQAAAAYQQADDARRAAELAEEGLLLFPGRLDLLHTAAYALMASYQNDAAIRRFEEALPLLQGEDAAPRQEADLLASLALLHSRKKDEAASDSLYARALHLDPEHPLALNNYAYSLAERGLRLEEALDMARRAVAREPENASFLDTLGWVLYRQGRYREAETWLDKSVATGRASASVYEHYGDVHAQLGDRAAAQRFWKEALQRNPENERLRKKLEEGL